MKYKCNWQRDRQTERRTDRQTDKFRNKRTDRQIYERTERQKQRQIEHFGAKWITIEIAIFFKERFKYLISSTLMPKLELTFQEGLIINGMENIFLAIVIKITKIVFNC